MSSFRRLKPSATPIPPVGSLTFPSLALPHLSTGIASLDDVLAPGQPLSSTLLARTPDGHSAWARLLERYWIAQGLISGQGVVIVAGPGEGEDVAQGMMWDVNAPRLAAAQTAEAAESGAESDGEDVLGDAEVDANRTKIAWRYGGLGKFKTTVDSSASSANSFGYSLALTSIIPAATLSNLVGSGQLTYLAVQPSRKGKGRCLDVEGELGRILHELQALVDSEDYSHASTSKQPHRALRICLPNLFSPAWGDVSHAHMFRFLIGLRALLRSSRSAAMVTLPPHLCCDKGLLERLMWVADGVIELQGFGSDPTLPDLFSHHHGLIHVHRPFNLHSLAPPSLKLSTLVGGRGGQNNLAFKQKRKAFVIETLHLDVEGGVGERRTTAPPSVSASAHSHDRAGHSHQHEPVESTGHDGAAARSGGGRVRIEMPEMAKEVDEITAGSTQLKPVRPIKSAMKKKTVAFAAMDPSKPELYEF